jgi:hypothetical protein
MVKGNFAYSVEGAKSCILFFVQFIKLALYFKLSIAEIAVIVALEAPVFPLEISTDCFQGAYKKG